ENKERGADLNLIQENQIDEASVEVEIEPESAGVTVSVGHLVDENLKPDVQAAG
ncbi:hypothetical protein MKW94_014480, partial [Papaver nudicaule]|nr:hypothetical protein [Papaver nudicaule]